MMTASTLETTSQDLRAKLESLQGYLNQKIIGKADTIETLLVSLLAGEHCYFVGPPGTAKSMMADLLAECLIDGDAPGRTCKLQFNRDLASERCFGPLNVKALVPDEGETRYVRLKGRVDEDGSQVTYAPEAHVLIMDEPANGNTGVLQGFHAILQERKFDTGEHWVDCPLQICIATSNDPLPLPELRALDDRFLMRHREGYLAPLERMRLLRMVVTKAFNQAERPSVHVNEIQAMRAEAAALPWDESAIAACEKIFAGLLSENIAVSDRQVTQFPKVVNAYAWMMGADAVRPAHLWITRHVFWKRLADADRVSDIIEDIVAAEAKEIRSLVSLAKQAYDTADAKAVTDRRRSPDDRLIAVKHYGEQMADVAGYGRTLRDNYSEAGPIYDEAVTEVRTMVKDMMAVLERAGVQTSEIKRFLKGGN